MSTHQALNLLVPTKLSPPPTQASWVRRTRLLARLGPVPATRLTLVIAPAGFGKSTLVAQWLREAHRGHFGDRENAAQSGLLAWLTLDEHDQDGVRFLAYVAGAIERATSGVLTATRPLLAATNLPPIYVIAQALLVDISALPSGLTLVLDDYHAITAEPIHQTVAYLLRNWPPTCRMVIISRNDPPLPLARLRAELQLTELRAAELRFTEAEAATLLTSLLGRAPERDQLIALIHDTEGWALALQLAALAVQQSPTASYAPGPMQRQITEYLADEVFAQQEPDIQAALLALAVPERVCAALGAVLLNPPDDAVRVELVLEQLERSNLFLLSLDTPRGWYRFHNLFRALLLRRLALTNGQEAVRALQLRAARWLEANGLFEEAMRQYLAAGADERAAELVERSLHVDLGRGITAAPPGYWLSLLPAQLVANRAGLALIEARLASFNTDVPALELSIARVDELLGKRGIRHQELPWPTFQGDLATLRGSLHYWQGRPSQAIASLKSALALKPVAHLASQALHILGKAFVADGHYLEGVYEIQDGFAEASDSLGRLNQATRYLSLCGMHATAGAVSDLAQDARRLAESVEALKLSDFWICYAEAYCGRAAYERSDLEVAGGHFSAVVRRKYQINAPVYIGCLAGLAQIAIVEGDLDTAAAYSQEVRAFAGEVGGTFLRNQALGCAVRLALARGDLGVALATAEGITPDIHEGINTWFTVEAPRLSQARALIFGADAVLYAQAEAIITSFMAEVEPLHNIRPLVSTLAALAQLRQAQGRMPEALASLERAAALAAPRGFVRALADCGSTLMPLLHTLAEKGVYNAYLTDVLGAYTSAQSRPARLAAILLSPPLPEMLTPRELEILGLLAERYSDKEIATQLVIAPNTVRKHTSTLFGKLGVSGRREAVSVARALGLLPEA